MTPHDASEAAKLLVHAQQSGVRLDNLPSKLEPRDRNDAYLVQDAIIGMTGPIGGWKVQAVDRGGGRSCAPIPRDWVQPSPAVIRASAFQPAVEVEIGVCITGDLSDPAKHFTTHDIENAVGQFVLAIEVAGSRFTDPTTVSPLALIADVQSNAGVVYGSGISDWRSTEVAEAHMRLLIDGRKAGESKGGWSSREMLEAVTELANIAARRGHGLKPGDVVITGARIMPIRVAAGAKVRAEAPGFGTVDLTIE